MIVYLLRVFWHAFLGRLKPRKTLTDTFETSGRCSLLDLNKYGRMSDAGLLRVFELARHEMMVQFGMFWKALNREISPILAGAQFSSPNANLPRLWQKYTIRTVAVDMDSTSLYLVQKLSVNGDVVASIEMRVVFFTQSKGEKIRRASSGYFAKLTHDCSVDADARYISSGTSLAFLLDKYAAVAKGGVPFKERMRHAAVNPGDGTCDFDELFRDPEDRRGSMTEKFYLSDKWVHQARVE
ncbi:Thioesterase-like superfamily [Carpediemonas membranifera]|uniref:Thioesterase-like superfamily n=1 Tax=Carpediemonas membranifera TaxID=201153 RepID=A0A8J6E0Y5_9EUKA|nr:Thioesterase-like superfamily [Carpediemonas membranifera]|eukprot:KAG9389932.1 Thioesterase-like superfamily [Carpediemonas membranifera]